MRTNGFLILLLGALVFATARSPRAAHASTARQEITTCQAIGCHGSWHSCRTYCWGCGSATCCQACQHPEP
jgi:hypothetical protein